MSKNKEVLRFIKEKEKKILEENIQILNKKNEEISSNI